MKKYPKLHEILKKKKNTIKICLAIFLLAMLGCLISATVLHHRDIPNPVGFNETNSNHQWCYVDVEVMSDCFAVDEENQHYYFVWDDQFIYIALLDNDVLNSDLANIYDYSFSKENMATPKAVRITGMSEKIPNELRDIAINQLNTWYGQNYVTESNFHEIIGNYLINTEENPNSVAQIPFILGCILFVSFIIFSFITIHYKSQTKTTI